MDLDFSENLQLFRRSTICRTNVPSRKWPSCFLLSMNKLIIMHKTYFIQVFLRWTWIFRKIYLFLEDLQSVAPMYLAANGPVVFY